MPSWLISGRYAFRPKGLIYRDKTGFSGNSQHMRALPGAYGVIALLKLMFNPRRLDIPTGI